MFFGGWLVDVIKDNVLHFKEIPHCLAEIIGVPSVEIHFNSVCGDLRDIIDSGLKEKSIPNLISKNVKSITVKRKESLNGIKIR